MTGRARGGANSAAGEPRSDDAVAYPLLAAKMTVPAARSPSLARDRLLRLVSHGVEGPLTLVSAAAGAGKTYLLASWVAAGLAPGPVAWLRLDVGDDAPGVFWTYLVAALRRAGVVLADVGTPMRADDVDWSFLARVADGLATQPQPVVLVIDEFDAVSSRGVVDGLAFVLRNAEPMLRLVVLSRTPPALSAHRHRLAGQMLQIGTADLAFSAEEAAELLGQHGVRLPADALAALTEHTKGWAAGLRLSAIAMQRRVDPAAFIIGLPADAALTGYLVDEVLNAQTTDVREFLLRTSVAGRLCPALANELSDRADAEVLLPALVTGNVLTEALDEPPDWYAYHPLFAQVLRGELLRAYPDLVPKLHLRASAWFDTAGLLLHAVQHAVAASDWQQACQVVVRHLAVGGLLAGRQTTRLSDVFAHLPPGEPSAACAIVRAARAAARFDYDGCRAQLNAAARAIEDDVPEGGDRAAAQASVAVIRAVAARAFGDVEEAERAGIDGERHLAALPERAAAHPEMRALLLSSVGSAQLWAGQFENAERTLRRGLAAARAPGCEYPRLNMLGRLAGVEFRYGHLKRAAQLGQAALVLAETCGLPVQYRTGVGHLTLAMVAIEWNDRAAARQHLDNAEKTIGARYDPFVVTVVGLLRAWQYAMGRDYRRAFAAVANVLTRVGDRPLPAWIAARVALTEAAIHLRRGDNTAALAALDCAGEHDAPWMVLRAGVAFATGDRVTMTALVSQVIDDKPAIEASVADSWLLLARARREDGDVAGARDALRQALAVARLEGHRRPFVEAGRWLTDLLRGSPDLISEHHWLGPPFVERISVPGGGSPLDHDPPAALVERLTEREQAVLRLLAQAKSTDDIAAELFVSVNTVKTHQKSVYRKLAVSRRADAVRRGRQLGLI